MQDTNHHGDDQEHVRPWLDHRRLTGDHMSTLSMTGWLLQLALMVTAALATAPDACAAQAAPPAPFIVVSDEGSGVYPAGRDIIFTIKPGEGGTAADLATATLKVLFNGTVECAAERSLADGVMTLRVKTAQPGSYRCDAAQPAVGKAPPVVISAGTIVAPEAIRAPVAEPPDFDAFWKAKKAALASQPLTSDLKPISAELAKTIPKSASVDYECLDLTVNVPLEGIRPVRGLLSRPKVAKPGSCPAILYLHAAGVSGSIPKPWEGMNLANEYGAIVLDINAHGIPNDQPKDFYFQLEQHELNGYKLMGIHNRDTVYFVGMYARLLQSVAFLSQQKEWDGRHLIAIGGSQGGGQALAIAGLDARVSAVSAAVPAMCNFSGVLHQSTSGWPNPVGCVRAQDQAEVAAAVSYCDNVNLATRSKAETQIFVGLIDPVCPPQGIYAAFNNLTTRKTIIAHPHRGHSPVPKEDLWIGDDAALQKDFIKHHIAQ